MSQIDLEGDTVEEYPQDPSSAWSVLRNIDPEDVDIKHTLPTQERPALPLFIANPVRKHLFGLEPYRRKSNSHVARLKRHLKERLELGKSADD